MRSLRLVACLLVLSLTGCLDQGDRPPDPGVVLIVQDDAEMLHREPERVAATLDDLRDLGVDWLRITAQWRAIVASAGEPPDWSALDRAVRMAGERGLEVAIDIAFGPPQGATLADYPDFAAAVAARYPQAVAFTVWNEPNHPVFLQPQWRREGERWVPASPDAYRQMLYDAVPRIRDAAPEALVLIGATSSLGDAQGSRAGDRMAPLTFVRALACVDADREPLATPACRDFEPLPGDGFSHHPYSGSLAPGEHDPDQQTVRLADLGRLRGLLDDLHDAGRLEQDLPLYLTEYGYQTNPPDPTWDVTPDQQARWLAEAEQIARAEPTVRSVAHFLHRDLGKRTGDSNPWGDYQSGLLYEDGTRKPAHAALALPLVAHRAGPKRVRFWGLVRPGDGERTATVEVRAVDAYEFEPLLEVQTNADGIFERTADIDPDASFRLVAEGRTGAILRGAG